MVVPRRMLAKKQRKMTLAPRGFDFLARWSQGAWAESKAIETINASNDYLAVPYGPSRGDPVSYAKFSEWKKFFEDYRQKMEKSGKRPDLLTFKKDVLEDLEERQLIDSLSELDDSESSKLVQSSSAGLEVETSLWKAKKALQLGTELSFTIKEEDMDRLTQWEKAYQKPLLVIQVFYDSAYIISYVLAKQLINEGKVKKAKKDRKTGKLTYKIPISFGKLFAVSVKPPSVESRILENEKGMIMAFPIFKGGKFTLTASGLEMLRST